MNQQTELKRVTRARYLMGCIVQIEVFDPSSEAVLAGVEAAFSEMKRVENLLSKFIPGSEVSLINQKASKRPLVISSEVFELLETAKRYFQLTEGVFDITAGVLTELWQKAFSRNHLPARAEIKGALAKTGMSELRLDSMRETVHLGREGMQIDLGAVGKGYAVDRAVEILRQNKITQAMVTTGSTIYFLGKEEAQFGILDPKDAERQLTAVGLQNNAISTSANNERWGVIGRKKYGHLIHPKTGIPYDGRVLSSSVIHPSARVSDMLATALFLLEPAKGRALVEKLAQTRAILLTRKFWGRSLEFYGKVNLK